MYGGGGNQFDGGASLFSGGGFMPSQSTTQTPDSSFSKSRSGQGVLPLTVKQISEAYHSNDDKSNFAVDGVDATNVKMVGIVLNKAERVTDVSFTLDDGTGKIAVNRWVNEVSETEEMAFIENGMYVTINGSLKGFQGKKQVVAFSVRPIVDFNAITLHFIECIHVHLENTRPKVSSVMAAETSVRTSISNQATPYTAVPGSDIRQLVLDIFQEPASLAREHGLHVNEIIKRLGQPANKIMEAINEHVDVGNIYSTIDEYHFKSTANG